MMKGEKMLIDQTDKKIISALRKNSRASTRDIAAETKIRPSTVHKRLTELVNNKVIRRFTIKTDNTAVGEDFIVFMFITTSSDLPESFFNDQHVKESFGITGEYDLLIKMKFSDIKEFNDYIIKLRKNKSITKTITYIATINLKEEI
jgi:DNA-binding Lrp family transcriptional regulator